MLREGHTEKVTLAQSPDGGGRGRQVAIQGKNAAGRGYSQCKGPGTVDVLGVPRLARLEQDG